MAEEKREEAFFENLAEEWLADWRNLDFSWDGLARAEWASGPGATDNLKCWRAPLSFPGNGKLVGQGDRAYIQATLQDYWRWSYGLDRFGEFENLDDQSILLSDDDLLEAGLLTEWNGSLWHIAHRPETDLKNAIPQHEQGIVNLAKIVKERILRSRSDDGGPDHRLQLVGTRVRNLHELWNQLSTMGTSKEDKTLFLRSEYSEFKGFVARNVRLGRGSKIESTLFVDSANFQTAVFEEGVTLDHSRFLASADFYKARLSRGVSFADVVFRGAANFESAELGWGTKFTTARFKQKADFSRAKFGGNADFFGCHFLNEADFGSSDFGGDTNFGRAKFNDEVVFSNAKLASASFHKTSFAEKIFFESTDLTLAKFKDIDFRDTEVCWNGATLDDAEFSQVAYRYQLLRGNCKGIKGSSSIWGDLLLRRDLQDQDYIDTLDSRLRAERPELKPWIRAPAEPVENVAARLKRLGQNASVFGQNTLTALDPKLPTAIWAIMMICAILAGAFAAAVIEPSILPWADSAQSGSAESSIGGLAKFSPMIVAVLISTSIASLISSWFGKRAVFLLWGLLGYGRDWDRVALFALFLVTIFGAIYHFRVDIDIKFEFALQNCDLPQISQCEPQKHWFSPWFVAAMGFATLGISDVASPLTGAGQLLLIANVLAGFTIFGLLLAVLGNRFARRS